MLEKCHFVLIYVFRSYVLLTFWICLPLIFLFASWNLCTFRVQMAFYFESVFRLSLKTPSEEHFCCWRGSIIQDVTAPQTEVRGTLLENRLSWMLNTSGDVNRTWRDISILLERYVATSPQESTWRIAEGFLLHITRFCFSLCQSVVRHGRLCSSHRALFVFQCLGCDFYWSTIDSFH